MEWNFDPVAGPFEGLVDGPLWDGEGLVFCLVDESRILRYEPGSKKITELRKYTARTRALALDPQGAIYGCQSASRRIVRFLRDLLGLIGWHGAVRRHAKAGADARDQSRCNQVQKIAPI